MRNFEEPRVIRIQGHSRHRYGCVQKYVHHKYANFSLDTIDVSNLNRQFLFRQADVGRPKAEVAAEFVEKRVKGVKITPFCGKIQDKDEDYYMQFNIIICGLDSVEARRWINATLVGMCDEDNPDSLKPLIDGGTEGMLTSFLRT